MAKTIAHTLQELEQGTYWTDRSGRRLRIEEMDATHRFNVARFLLTRAKLLGRATWFETMVRTAGIDFGDGVNDALDRHFDEVLNRSEEWIRGTPLYRALTAELPQRWDPPAATSPARHSPGFALAHPVSTTRARLRPLQEALRARRERAWARARS